MSDIEAGEVLLDRYIMVHLKNNEDKFVLLMEMISKLYKLANDEISPDNPDSLNNHVCISNWIYFIQPSIQSSIHGLFLLFTISLTRIHYDFSQF